jgi:hypothetical protein
MGLSRKIGLCASFAAVFGMVIAGVYIQTTKLASSGQTSSTESTSAGSTSDTSASSIGSTADANNAE